MPGSRLVYFICLLNSNAELSWYDSNSEISDHGKFRVLESGDIGILEIFDTELTDSGEIICLAVNDVSVATAVAILSVTG